jgi:hypothetical protein
MGGLVMFEFWHLHKWATEYDRVESVIFGKEIRRPIMKEYTRAMVNYCQTAKEKTGKASAIVGIQN